MQRKRQRRERREDLSRFTAQPMSPEKRKYELRRRAEGMEETRRRITEAAVELHGTFGPGPHVAVGGGRACGCAAAHAVPPLPGRGRAVHGLLGPFRGSSTRCRTRSAGARSRTRRSGWRRASASSTAGTSRPSRCSPTSTATRRWWRPWPRTCAPMNAYVERGRPHAGVRLAGPRRAPQGAQRGGPPRRRLPHLALARQAGGVSRAQAVKLARALVESAARA